MDNYFEGSKLYTMKNSSNTYSIYVLLGSMYEHELLIFGMEKYTNQSNIIINEVLKNCNVIENCGVMDNPSFPDKESAEACIVTLNMLRTSN